MLGSRNAPLPQVNEPPTFATMNQTENEFVGVTRGILNGSPSKSLNPSAGLAHAVWFRRALAANSRPFPGGELACLGRLASRL